ncbi:MAG: aminotransferase class I/II-fold pyridoxal phosphate-dependent enzyme, partial [Candidatus Omnitrophota bacterium]
MSKVIKSIPLSIPYLNGNEGAYIQECVDSGWVSSVGKFVDRFEQNICVYTGAKHAVACVNGTAGLQVALRLAGVNPGNEVIVPTLTFIAPVNAVKYLYAEPVFMDCDNFMTLDVEKLQEFCSREC